MDRDAVIVVDGHEILELRAPVDPNLRPRPSRQRGSQRMHGSRGAVRVGDRAKPNTQVIVLSGDGSFGFNGMEIDTMNAQQDPVLIVISNNGGWASIGGMSAGRDLGVQPL